MLTLRPGPDVTMASCRGSHNSRCYAVGNRATTAAKLPLEPVRSQTQVPLPQIREQQRIAEILDKADALRAKRRAALVQLETLTQAIFLDMLETRYQKSSSTREVSDFVAEFRGGRSIEAEVDERSQSPRNRVLKVKRRDPA